MGELIRALRHFIARDVLYVVGGGSVILSFLYFFDQLPDASSVSTAMYLLAAGIAYVVGYTIQEAFSLTGLLTSSYVTAPGRLVRFLYGRFTGRQWTLESDFDPLRANVTISAYADELNLVELHRIIALRQAGTTTASSGFVCAVLLGAKAFCNRAPFDITLAVAVLVLSLVAWALGWIKAAQQTQYMRQLSPMAERARLRAEGS